MRGFGLYRAKAMDDQGGSWLGPGETAVKLGVTVKALRVFEREGLVTPARTEGGWRVYGPPQMKRLHLVIVLRDLGLPLKSIADLLAGNAVSLAAVLTAQQTTLEQKQRKLAEATRLLTDARKRIALGEDLGVEDLATLTRDTVLNVEASALDMDDRMKALVERHLAPAEIQDFIGQFNDQMARIGKSRQELADEGMIFLAEAQKLMALGETDSEAAKGLIRRWLALTGSMRRPEPAVRQQWVTAMTEAMADPETASTLPFDAAVMAFIQQVVAGMKARGELPQV